MDNVFIIATIISVIFLICKFIEMRFVDSESKPLKLLIRDTLLVYFSVIFGYFIMEQLNKLFETTTAEKIILQAKKDGHIKGDYPQYLLDAAKEIAKKFDSLNPEEQKTMRDTYYKAFLKKIKK